MNKERPKASLGRPLDFCGKSKIDCGQRGEGRRTRPDRKADLFIYDKDGNEINHYQNIDIPLQRNKETVVRGPFLTLERGSGGIGIDDEFEGEHVVEVTY